MIELLEHNKETYKRLCDVLADNNKCALVQATGTGKSYIAGKYIEEHTNTALILVPTNAIADAWSDLLNRIEQEVDIITYQAFAKEPNNYLEYDLVIADEMHHLGSDVWGKKFVETYLQSENHKIIGLTATEIRYLDNSRDMAEEIFENIRVDGCDLPTAINTGVLPTFKYVSALYCDESDFDKWREKAGKIKDIKAQTELKGRLDVCIKNMVSVKQAVNENLTDDYKKIIVFLNNVESKETALEMFKDVFPTANFYDVDYSKSRSENNLQIGKFKADSDRAALFAVDMLSEGVHVKGADCVIMFRKTISPQIYFQQLGRGLASGADKEPIIFDFVSNVKNISSKFKTDTESNYLIIREWNKRIGKDKKIVFKNYISNIEDILFDISEFTNTKEWTKEEDNFLIENYEKMTKKDIANKLKRTQKSVEKRGYDLGITKKTSKYTNEEIEFVKAHANDMEYEEIATALGVTRVRVRNIAQLIGIKKRGVLLPENAKKYIRANYGNMKTFEIARYLGISEQYVRKIANDIGVSNNGVRYKKEDEEFIKNNCKKMSFQEIAKILGKTESSVKRKAYELGISTKNSYSKDEDEFISENYSTMTYKDIAQKLHRNYQGVKNRARKLGIKKEI